jgi:hypothetical protein
VPRVAEYLLGRPLTEEEMATYGKPGR